MYLIHEGERDTIDLHEWTNLVDTIAAAAASPSPRLDRQRDRSPQSSVHLHDSFITNADVAPASKSPSVRSTKSLPRFDIPVATEQAAQHMQLHPDVERYLQQLQVNALDVCALCIISNCYYNGHFTGIRSEWMVLRNVQRTRSHGMNGPTTKTMRCIQTGSSSMRRLPSIN